MDFVSLNFLSCLILFILISWIWSVKVSPYLLVAFGLAVIFLISPLTLAILIAESSVCYYITRSRIHRFWVISFVSVILIFTVFLVFKFLALRESILFPLGISYFSFRLMHYIQESYRNKLREHSFIEFLAYVTFFPTFFIGPINLFPEFIHDLRRRTWNSQRFSYGLERVVYGYAQLIIIGNYLINFLFLEWNKTSFTGSSEFTRLIVHSVHLWLDLYVRFSAYSSIAIGISAMAGFSVPENFNYPFLATNIREFWQRWHMSLTNWCREYIFIPVAAYTRMPFLAIAATMVTIGIWHELSIRYILWGFYHAFGIVIYERYSRISSGIFVRNKFLLTIKKGAGILITLVFVVASFPFTTLVYNFLINMIK